MEYFDCRVGDVVLMRTDDDASFIGMVEVVDTNEIKNFFGDTLLTIQSEAVGVRFFTLAGDPSFLEDVEFISYKNLDLIGNIDDWNRGYFWSGARGSQGLA